MGTLVPIILFLLLPSSPVSLYIFSLPPLLHPSLKKENPTQVAGSVLSTGVQSNVVTAQYRDDRNFHKHHPQI